MVAVAVHGRSESHDGRSYPAIGDGSLQYQKRLRLLEAQRLMVNADQTAQASAYAVGYQSASQFSREYARMFGEAPSRHTAKLRRAVEIGRASIDDGARPTPSTSLFR